MAEINLDRIKDQQIDADYVESGTVNQNDDMEPVTQKPAIRRRRSAARHMLRSFLEEDGHNAMLYVFWDIIVPNIKALAHDILDKGSARMLWGDGGTSSYSSANPYRPQSSYNNYSSYSKPTTRPISNIETRSTGYGYNSHRGRDSFFVDDIYVETLDEANDIEGRLEWLIRKKGFALVSDYYNAAGLESNYIDGRFGWYDIRGMKKIRGKDGIWIIEMPIPDEIAEVR